MIFGRAVKLLGKNGKMPQIHLNGETWRGKRVLLTGHTGFKGAWMHLLLQRLGAKVTSLALEPETEPNLSKILSLQDRGPSFVCDIREFQQLQSIVQSAEPEIVIHMAAQALVKESYRDPVGTIESNVMGTVYLLEALRSVAGLQSVLVVTSDKVYENREAQIDFKETSPLGGYDPYSASKASAEILARVYQRSFFKEKNIPLVTVRAGNVIGGGDWAKDRLLPDIWRAYEKNQQVVLRNPRSVRPWQHVLDPIYGYLLYVEHSLNSEAQYPLALNFAPPRDPILDVEQVAEVFSQEMNCSQLWKHAEVADTHHESRFLSIDSSLALETLGWKTLLPPDEAIRWTSQWYKAFKENRDMLAFTYQQIDKYAELANEQALRNQ